MTSHGPERESRFFDAVGKLRITRQNSQWLGGVAAGIAQRFNLDVVLVRGIIVALSILGGLGLVLYGIAWAVLPDTQGQIHLEQASQKQWTSGMTGSLIMMALGIFPAPWFLNTIGPVLWPLTIVAAILFLVFSRKNTKFERPSKSAAGTYSKRNEETATESATEPKNTKNHGTSLEKTWLPENSSFSVSASPSASTNTYSYTPKDTTDSEEHLMTTEQPDPYAKPSDEQPTTSGYNYGSASANQSYGYSYGSHNPAKQDKLARKARLAPPIPGWLATTIVGLTILVIAAVLGLDYLNVYDLPGSGWGVAFAGGLVVVGTATILAAAAKRTSGGLLGLAIPLLVATLIFGSGNFSSGNRGIVNTTDSDGNYTAVFSSSTIDLTDQANITSDTTVEIDSVFSRLDLKLPSNIKVRVQSDGAFISNRQGELPQDLAGFSDEAPTLTVHVDGVASSISTSVVSSPNKQSTDSSF